MKENTRQLTREQVNLLNKPLPEKAIKQHPTKSYLSSIKAIYITERLNQVFGVGSWSTKVEAISHNVENGMVVVKTTLEIPEYGIYYECYGGNDNGGSSSKNFDLGDAYKGATTDAITKIGSYLGIAIDVFKGVTRNNLPDEKLKEAKTYMDNGGDIEVLRQKYYINIDQENKLLGK